MNSQDTGKKSPSSSKRIKSVAGNASPTIESKNLSPAPEPPRKKKILPILVITATVIAATLLAVFLIPSMHQAEANTGITPPENTQSNELITHKSDMSTPSVGTTDEAVTEQLHPIAVKDYGCEFNILNAGTMDSRTLTGENAAQATANRMDAAVYERSLRIQEHLGVDMVYTLVNDGDSYAGIIAQAVQAESDDYQMMLTHTSHGISELITGNCLYDIGKLDVVDLEAPYWATDMMEEIKIRDEYLLGYNDFCMISTHVVAFNKTLMEEFNRSLPYDQVRDRNWTLFRLLELSMGIYADANANGTSDAEDMHGLSCVGRASISSLLTSSHLNVVAPIADGTYGLGSMATTGTERTHTLVELFVALSQSPESYFVFASSDTPNGFAEHRSLFELCHISDLASFRESGIDYGLLPYPLFEQDQRTYRSLSWNGMIGVPRSIADPTMVGEVLELIGYYSPNVKTAYMEKLLGTTLDQAPDDAEMLSIIWDSQVTDMGLLISAPSQELQGFVHLIPTMCERGSASVSSYLTTYSRAVEAYLRSVFGS